MRTRIPVLTVLAAALLASQAAPARATLATEVELPAMTEYADLIVRGAVEKRRTTNEGGHLYTQVTVRVREVHKGVVPADGVVVVRTLGGQSGLLMERIDGEPTFALGDDVVLFLYRDGFYFRPQAMAQGKFDVRRDPVSRREYLSRDLSGISFVTFAPDGHLTINHSDQAVTPATYTELVTTVRRQVARTAMMRAAAARAVEIARAQVEVQR